MVDLAGVNWRLASAAQYPLHSPIGRVGVLVRRSARRPIGRVAAAENMGPEAVGQLAWIQVPLGSQCADDVLRAVDHGDGSPVFLDSLHLTLPVVVRPSSACHAMHQAA